METNAIKKEIEKLQKESYALLDGLKSCYHERTYEMSTPVAVRVHRAMRQAREMNEALIAIKVACLAYEQGKSDVV